MDFDSSSFVNFPIGVLAEVSLAVSLGGAGVVVTGGIGTAATGGAELAGGGVETVGEGVAEVLGLSLQPTSSDVAAMAATNAIVRIMVTPGIEAVFP
jgi:hypothetical protein